MTTAKDYAQAAAQVRTITDQVRPAPAPPATPGDQLIAPAADPYRQARELIVYHLRQAAAQLQAIAEAKAPKETPAE